MITITDAAIEKFKAFRDQEKKGEAGLRIQAMGGGCSGVRFSLGFCAAGEETPEDKIIDAGGIRVIVDTASEPHVDGITVDYVETPMGSGFRVEKRPPNWPKERPQGPVAEKVQKVLDEKINPGLAGHGGFAELVDIQGDTVYLRLGGGCHGCGMASFTVKQGVEIVIREEVPEIQHVRDVTEHAEGTNPYYQSQE